MEKGPIEKKNKMKLVIIVLSVLIVALTSIIGYFAVSDKALSAIFEIFESNKKNTVLLDEFVVNLRSENYLKNYLKIEVALMCANKKHEKIIISNISEIRDIIRTDLSKKSSSELLDVENIPKIKEEIMNDINEALKDSIVMDVFFTDMVIQ